MANPPRHFKFSGMISPNDPWHQPTFAALGAAPDEHYIAPVTVNVNITNPPPPQTIGVPQYSPTVIGQANGYNPSGDCNGNFMSYKFQPNNNCYAYGCNITSNTFPQPGRASGNLITSATLNGQTISNYAVQDGLIFVGTSKSDINNFVKLQPGGSGNLNGHFVALMISPPGDQNWPGDYHWARCDDSINYNSWSQKDGNDQVTNFDFAGNPITDPAQANWTVNQGPMSNNQDCIVDYQFYCYMFVPNSGVNII